MKSLSIVFLLLLFSNFIFSQSRLERVAYGTKSFDFQPLSEEKKIELTNIIKKDYQKVKKCNDVKCEVGIYIRVASFHYLLDASKDTVAFYLDKAKEVDPVRTCGLINKWVNERGKDKRIGMQRDFFAKEFSSEWWSDFMNDCQPILDTLTVRSRMKKKKDEEIANVSYAEILRPRISWGISER